MNRRNLLKQSSLGAIWLTPVIQAVILPTHAMTSETADPSALKFSASLDQAQEAPPTGDAATGAASMVYNSLTGEFTLTATIDNLVDFTAAHIHAGAVGVSGSVVVILTSGYSAGTLNYSGTIPTAYQADVLAGNTYINIHNAAHSAGAIRGQLLLS